jgi:hypothetical protein
VAASVLVGSLVVTTARWGPDWPAQEFRSALARSFGLLAWDDQWYGGHAMLGYSVLYPVVSSILGAPVTGLVAVAVSAYAAVHLLPVAITRRQHMAFAAVIALSLGANLLIGQIPFLLSTAFGLLCLLALERGRSVPTALLSCACGLASPLGGAFVLMTIPAAAARTGWRRAALLAGAAAPLPVAILLGGAGGPFPFPWQSLLGVIAFCAGLWLATTCEDRVLRRLAVVYALAAVAAFVVPNPIGGNIGRLGKIIALPLATYLLVFRLEARRVCRAVAAVLCATGWFAVPAASAAVHGATDPSRKAAYYSGLLAFLGTQDPTRGRLEIPFTREHWETTFVASHYPLARGWERQTDLEYDAVLYGPLTAQSYRDWLDAQAVDLVALPSVPLDDGGRAEAALLRHPPAYLARVWSDRRWTVWRVRDAVPIVSGAGRLTRLDVSHLTARFAGPGSITVRVRWSLLWHVTSGEACVQPTSDGWLQVRSANAGDVTVGAGLNGAVLSRRYDCDLPG